MNEDKKGQMMRCTCFKSRKKERVSFLRPLSEKFS